MFYIFSTLLRFRPSPRVRWCHYHRRCRSHWRRSHWRRCSCRHRPWHHRRNRRGRRSGVRWGGRSGWIAPLGLGPAAHGGQGLWKSQTKEVAPYTF